MKARIDCTACRKRIYKEAETEYLKTQYKWFNDSAYSMAVFAVCGVLTSMVRRGRTKKYIKRLYDDMCVLFSQPDILGKEVSMTDVMHIFEKEYGIDWKKLEVHTESEEHYITGMRKEAKNDR